MQKRGILLFLTLVILLFSLSISYASKCSTPTHIYAEPNDETEICFNNIDENCDGYDQNQTANDANESTYCPCNEDNSGIIAKNNKLMACIYSETGGGAWVNAMTTGADYKIHDVNNNFYNIRNKELMSNSEYWYYCDASGTLGAGIFKMSNHGSFPYVQPPGVVTGSTKDISKSFICYGNSGYNNIAECCSTESGCHNADRNVASAGLRVFGNGENMRSVYTFDELSGGILTDNLVSYSSYDSQKGPSLSLPPDMRNLASFGSISFDIRFSGNVGKNVIIAFTDKNLEVLKPYSIADYIAYKTPSIWHRVKITNLDFSLTNVSNIMFYYQEPREFSSLNIEIDNIIVGNENYYCSEFRDRWVSDLDPQLLYEKVTYEKACSGVPSFGWTGNKCCGDDYQEFYSDSLGGCWKGYPVMNDTIVKQPTNNDSLKDLIFVNSSGNIGFYQCLFSKTYADTTTICEVKASCSSFETEVLQMSNDVNAHASKDGSYPRKLCCITSKLQEINSNNRIYLSANTNAHVSEDNKYFQTEVKIGNGGTASCSITSSCPPGSSSLFSLSSQANAHIAKPLYYNLNYCCGVTGYPVDISRDYSSEVGPAPPKVDACNIKGSYFCALNNLWSNEGVKSGSGETIPASKRDNLKNTSDLIVPGRNLMPEITLTNIASDSSCCPAEFCWNGTTCIDGNIADSSSVPKANIYTIGGQIPEKAVLCAHSLWVVKEKKYSPFHDYSGYCHEDSQCYYNDNAGGAGRCYNDSTFVNESGEYTDFYCSGGSWSSRTKLLADALLGIGGNNAFSIFCDNIKEGVTINYNYMYQSQTAIDLQKYAVKLREGQNDVSTSACVLSIDQNNNGVMGDSGDDVIIGIPLKNELGGNDEFFISLTECFGGAIPANKNEYVTCQGDYYRKVYYNSFTKTAIFSEKQFDVEPSANIFSKIIDWFKSFLGLTSQIGKSNSNYPSLMHANNSNFTNMLNNHIYYYNNGEKQISATKEYKYMTSNEPKKYAYLIYANYSGFNLPLCKGAAHETPRQMQPGSGSSITCNEANTTVIMELNPTYLYTKSDYWADLTARTRAK